MFNAEGVDPRAYSLGVDDGECYCLVADGAGGFRIYFSERGHRVNERAFNSWSAAADALASIVLHDPTTRAAYMASHQGPGFEH